ncbi:hypothetical protein KY312_02700 [Candidatus Woesearchaeota archaeon]|nr:hypothetical protein [Candidatus Woesearchaeota archaeon]
MQLENDKVLFVAVVAVIGIVAVMFLNNATNTTQPTKVIQVPTGAAVGGAAPKKTHNTPCARTCTQDCTPNAVMPYPGTEELAVHDCIIQCLNARCNQASHAGNCNPDTADDCCNIFAVPGQDPDCVVECPAFDAATLQAAVEYWSPFTNLTNWYGDYPPVTLCQITSIPGCEQPLYFYAGKFAPYGANGQYDDISCDSIYYNLVSDITEDEMLACKAIIDEYCPGGPGAP